MNIKLEYLYRDAANFKNWGEVVFSNPQNMDVALIVSSAEKVLIDQIYFFAERAAVPNLYFQERDDELDHSWHEVYAFQETNDHPNDLLGRDIREFIDSLQGASKT